MSKQKTTKSVEKRIKVTSKGKILRRHQLGAGHLKSHKSKGALNRAKKTKGFAKGEVRAIRRMLGI